jgi:hypothetical protein
MQICNYGEETIQPPSIIEEDENAIEKLNNKSPWVDNLQANLLKYSGKEMVNKLHDVILPIWIMKYRPKDWRKSIICRIHTMRDLTECRNCRWIRLLNNVYKVSSNTRTFCMRNSPHVEKVIRRYQCGFQKDMSTVEQIFSL